MRRPRSPSADTSGTKAGCSSGSPPVTTTLSTPASFTRARTSSRGISRPPPGFHEYFVSHHVQPTVQPCSRTNTDGVPTLGPSPWIEVKTSLTRRRMTALRRSDAEHALGDAERALADRLGHAIDR